MKSLLCLLVAGALNLPTVVHAGSVVASDGRGAYGYAYGDDPMEVLQHKALRNCRGESRHPDAARVVFRTRQKGHGVVLRYYVRGAEHIAAAGGASNPRAALRTAVAYVEGQGGERWEVADTWVDE